MPTLQEALAGAGYAVTSDEQLDALQDALGNDAEVERLRAMVVALEQECAALAKELDEDKHEYDPDPSDPGWCVCHYRADSRWHRTAAWVRRRYGFGAT